MLAQATALAAAAIQPADRAPDIERRQKQTGHHRQDGILLAAGEPPRLKPFGPLEAESAVNAPAAATDQPPPDTAAEAKTVSLAKRAAKRVKQTIFGVGTSVAITNPQIGHSYRQCGTVLSDRSGFYQNDAGRRISERTRRTFASWSAA